MSQDQSFFVGQKAFIARDGRVLVLFNPKGKIDFPGGKIQEGEEDFQASMVREIREEIGLDAEVGEPFTVWSFPLPAEHKNAGKKVFLVGFRASSPSGEVVLSSEHNSYRWIGPEDLRGIDDGSSHFHALQQYFK